MHWVSCKHIKFYYYYGKYLFFVVSCHFALCRALRVFNVCMLFALVSGEMLFLLYTLRRKNGKYSLFSLSVHFTVCIGTHTHTTYTLHSLISHVCFPTYFKEIRTGYFFFAGYVRAGRRKH